MGWLDRLSKIHPSPGKVSEGGVPVCSCGKVNGEIEQCVDNDLSYINIVSLKFQHLS